MPNQATRYGDTTIGIGSHGLPCCPHLITGTRISGSPDVDVNGRKASRAYIDIAVHSCPHCAINLCIQGSPTVAVDGKPLHRQHDLVTEFCGIGYTDSGSPDVSADEGGNNAVTDD